MDGQGTSYECQISSINKNEVVADILTSTAHKLPHHPHLAFGLIKNMARIEWLYEKVTEIGVQSITPLICARSERRHLRLDRLHKIIVSAAKQSLKFHLPKIHEPVEFDAYIGQTGYRQSFIAHYSPQHKNLWEYIKTSVPPVILIGPEGDFTTSEIASAHDNGIVGVNLGHSRLRAETASIVACTYLNASNA